MMARLCQLSAVFAEKHMATTERCMGKNNLGFSGSA
jgi:hypothetical protein